MIGSYKKVINDSLKSKSAACVILYNPDIERLKKNISAVFEQVNVVYCFDNASYNYGEIDNVLTMFKNCVYIKNTKNVGIASAINIVANMAIKNGYKWLLTLDQDSVCPSNMMESFESYVSKKNVAVICPRFVDHRRPDNNESKLNDYEFVDFCITSGSLMNLDLFFEIGQMDDYLFIGSIDDDYCYRAIQKGYKILQVNNVELDHELGVITPSKFSKIYICLGNIFNSHKLKALSYKRDVSPIRIYYATRNIVYLSEKYKRHPYKFSKKFAIYNGISSVIRAEHKMAVFNSFIKGFIDGIHK